MTEHGVDGGKGFVVDNGVELRFRQVGTERSAHLHGADGSTTGRVATVVVQQLAQTHAKAELDKPATTDIAGELDRQGAARAPVAEIAIPLRPVDQHVRHRGQGDQVVDHRGLSEQALDRRQRRLEANLAALAFQAFEQGRFLAADVGTRANAQIDIERTATAGDIRAQPTRGAGAKDRFGKNPARQRILAAQIHIALRRPTGNTGNQHAFNQAIRIAFQDHAIRKRARIAFVGIADDEFLCGRLVVHGLPLDAAGKGRAAASAQSGFSHGGNDVLRRHGQRAARTLPASMSFEVIQADRIDDAIA